MNKKAVIAFLMFLVVTSLYSLGDGYIFIANTTFKFGAVALVSITLYYFINRVDTSVDLMYTFYK